MTVQKYGGNRWVALGKKSAELKNAKLMYVSTHQHVDCRAFIVQPLQEPRSATTIDYPKTIFFY